MNIGVIGGGSLGLLLTSYLSSVHKVTLYVRRTSQLNEIKQKGIRLNRQNNFERNIQVKVALIKKLKEHDLIFITVKQPQIDDVLDYLGSIDSATRLVFLQNGMGHIGKISSINLSIYLAVVEHGAHRINDREVNHLGFGTIKLASFNGDENVLLNLQRQLHDDCFPFEVADDWKSLLKSKLLINAVINPLTALFNVPNGAIVSNSYIEKLAMKLTDEAAMVLGFNKNDAWEQVKRVAKSTAANTSSMRADILNGRVTEIEAISGYLLHETLPEQIPNTIFVYEAILALQERGKS